MATNAQWENPPGWQLTSACNTLRSSSEYVKNWGALFASQAGGCTNFTVSSYLSSYMGTSLEAQNGNRAWLFQQCTEFGFFDGVSYPGTSIFFDDVPLSFELAFCQRVFGLPLVPPIDATNARYGARNPEATRILYTNGLIDPWYLPYQFPC